MNLRSMVWKEIWERPAPMATGLLAVVLGVGALVAMRHVTEFSEREVTRQLSQLGANILILPQQASLQDYYAADLNGQSFPEQHASQILLAGLTGVERLSPKLCVPARVRDQAVTLTGILPQTEFAAQTAWQAATLFTAPKHVGCKKVHAPKSGSATPESLAADRTIDQLREHETVVGADAAADLRLRPGSTFELLGENFQVLAVLPPTGTVDDSRIFAHLHTVQRLTGSGEVVSAIEVLGCCEDAAGQLVPQLRQLLPDCKVVTISQLVATQVGINRLMARASLAALVVLTLVGGISVLSTLASNVRERRREIGTLMALGATPKLVARLFLLKAAWLGVLGGIVGSVLGTAVAIGLGPHWAGVTIAPLPQVALLACTIAVLVALLAAYWPARQAARLDPCTCLQEV